MADEARRYWNAVAAGDMQTANALARLVIDRLVTQGEEADRAARYADGAAFRLQAHRIERGELAPYPRDLSSPMTATDISLLELGRHVKDRSGAEWVVVAHPSHDAFMTGRPQAWSVGVTRVRDGVFTRIDSRNQWTLSPNGGDGGVH